MENRVTERLNAVEGSWSIVSFKDLKIGDIVRFDDIPNVRYRVDSEPAPQVIKETGNTTMAFLGFPIKESQYELPQL